MKLSVLVSTAVAFFALGCVKDTKLETPVHQSTDGAYILTFEIGEARYLPTNVIMEGGKIFILNAEEKIEAVDVAIGGNSLEFRMPAFNNRFFLTADGNGFAGHWHNYAKGDHCTIPVTLVPGTKRFSGSSSNDVSGNWKATFSQGSEGEYIAKGVFKQNGSKVTGTFRTTTGDYRYVEGVLDRDMLRISCFDGSHAFLFEAKLKQGNVLAGMFYSGNHWSEPWTAVKVAAYELPDPDTLTHIKDGEKFDFAFPNTKGEIIKFSDFAGKPTIVQITGTWCPNCMDETVLLNVLYEKYRSNGLEIVALAFEPVDTFEAAVGYIDRFKADMNVDYEILFAGNSDKEEAVKSLPMLNHIKSYPTTLFFDKQGNLLKLHTGFNGPATDNVYTDFVDEITDLIENKML
ncbi:MAG: TlpA disulfide reductase family protein [Myxococcota bacterium]|nr:TlpA disulfide reductase family protein [Myxococcota bacterium]